MVNANIIPTARVLSNIVGIFVDVRDSLSDIAQEVIGPSPQDPPEPTVELEIQVERLMNVVECRQHQVKTISSDRKMLQDEINRLTLLPAPKMDTASRSAPEDGKETSADAVRRLEMENKVLKEEMGKKDQRLAAAWNDISELNHFMARTTCENCKEQLIKLEKQNRKVEKHLELPRRDNAHDTPWHLNPRLRFPGA